MIVGSTRGVLLATVWSPSRETAADRHQDGGQDGRLDWNGGEVGRENDSYDRRSSSETSVNDCTSAHPTHNIACVFQCRSRVTSISLIVYVCEWESSVTCCCARWRLSKSPVISIPVLHDVSIRK